MIDFEYGDWMRVNSTATTSTKPNPTDRTLLPQNTTGDSTHAATDPPMPEKKTPHPHVRKLFLLNPILLNLGVNQPNSLLTSSEIEVHTMSTPQKPHSPYHSQMMSPPLSVNHTVPTTQYMNPLHQQ